MMKLAYLILLLTCAVANAQIYSYVDKNGDTVYTDNPPEHQATRKLDIQLTQPVQSAQPRQEEQPQQPAQTISDEVEKTIRLSPDTRLPSQSDQTTNTSPASVDLPSATVITSYQHIDIISPANNETIRNTAGLLTVIVKSEPALASNHQYRFLIDGKTVGQTTTTTYNISNLDRGEHKLVVEIINTNDQQVLIKSQEHVIFIKQTSLAEKRRIKPCSLDEYGVRPECPLKDKPKKQPRNLLLKITDLTGLTTV